MRLSFEICVFALLILAVQGCVSPLPGGGGSCTAAPVRAPTPPPTPPPTKYPTTSPTKNPTRKPTSLPTQAPSCDPLRNYDGGNGGCTPVTCDEEYGICGEFCYGNGNGKCTSCKANAAQGLAFGADCKQLTSCNLFQGTCEQNRCWGVLVEEDTGCTSCFGPFADPAGVGFYGRSCDDRVNCIHGTCTSGSCWGIDGSGSCDLDENSIPICDDGWTGENCDVEITCLLENAVEQQYNMDTGLCVECIEGYEGNRCHIKTKPPTCFCVSSECLDLSTELMCDDCAPEYFGTLCDMPVTCNVTNGTCNAGTCFGPTADGTCTLCDTGFFGPTCDGENPICDKGVCPIDVCGGVKGSGKCVCEEGWAGPTCATRKAVEYTYPPTDATVDDTVKTVTDEEQGSVVSLIQEYSIPIGIGAGASILMVTVVSLFSSSRRKKAFEVSSIESSETSDVGTLMVDNPLFGNDDNSLKV